MAEQAVTVWSGIALAALGAAALRFRVKPLRRFALAGIPLGALLACLGDARQALGVAAVWVCLAWLYNR